MNTLDQQAQSIIDTLKLAKENNHIRIACLSMNCNRVAQPGALVCGNHDERTIMTPLLKHLRKHKPLKKQIKALVFFPTKTYKSAKERDEEEKAAKERDEEEEEEKESDDDSSSNSSNSDDDSSSEESSEEVAKQKKSSGKGKKKVVAAKNPQCKGITKLGEQCKHSSGGHKSGMCHDHRGGKKNKK